MNALPLVAAALSVALVTASCREAQIPLPPEAPATAPTVAVETAVSEGSPPPFEIVSVVAGICNIESIGDLSGPALAMPVQVASDTSIAGWRSHQAADGSEAPAWLRVVAKDGSVAFQTYLVATGDRPDVAAAVNRPGALRSGFREAKIVGLSPGPYTLEVVLNAGPEWVRCAHTRAIEVK